MKDIEELSTAETVATAELPTQGERIRDHLLKISIAACEIVGIANSVVKISDALSLTYVPTVGTALTSLVVAVAGRWVRLQRRRQQHSAS